MSAQVRQRLGWIVVILLFSGAALLLFIDYLNFHNGGGLKYGRATLGATAPDVAFVALDGARSQLREYRGTPLVVNFFATWCVPCKAELPLLESRYISLHARGLMVLGADEQEGAREVRVFVHAHALTFPVVIDQGSAIDAYGGDAIPTSLFIDRSGILRAVHIGEMTADILDTDLQKIM